MRRHLFRARARFLLLAGSIDACLKQKRPSREEVRERCCQGNTTLPAGQARVEELPACEQMPCVREAACGG